VKTILRVMCAIIRKVLTSEGIYTTLTFILVSIVERDLIANSLLK
jgi:hypothetical protein